MYLKSLVVFALCTVFVLSFVVVLNDATSGVGKEDQGVTTSQPSCSISSLSCGSFSIASASLHTVNYTDELGVVNYANLILGVNASGGSSLTSLALFVDNMSAGTVQGPFEPGVVRVVNLTLPATVSISPGKTYLLSVEGFYNGNSAVWESVRITAK